MSEAEGLGLGAGEAAADRGEGLGERGEWPTQSRPLTPSGPGQRDGASVPDVGAAETAPSRGAEQDAARDSAVCDKASSSRSPGPQRPEGSTLQPKKARKRRVKLNKADRAVRDPMIYQQVRGEMR